MKYRVATTDRHGTIQHVVMQARDEEQALGRVSGQMGGSAPKGKESFRVWSIFERHGDNKESEIILPAPPKNRKA